MQNQLFREVSVERVSYKCQGQGAWQFSSSYVLLSQLGLWPLIVLNIVAVCAKVQCTPPSPLPLLFSSVMGGNMFGKAGSLLTCLENGEEGGCYWA